jgi:hypothetical protein
MGMASGLVAKSGLQMRSANARAQASMALMAAARWRGRDSSSAVRRASSKVVAMELAKRAARASASGSSYSAARRIRLSRPISRSSGSRSALSTMSVTAMTSIQRRISENSPARTRRARVRSRRRCGSISSSSVPRRHSVARPRARARAVMAPPSPW